MTPRLRLTASRLRPTAAAVALVLGLGACSTALPTDPTPRVGRPVAVQPRDDGQWILPAPQPGAEPTQVVSDFLRANPAFGADDEGEVVRSYLTGALATTWVPTSNVLVYRGGSPAVTEQPDGSVVARVEVAGRIDGEGRLTEEPAGTVTEQEFGLTRVGGEWRIDTFPEAFGVWISDTDLRRVYQSSTVYYLEPAERLFVPEVRWLPRGEGLTTALARAQLAPVPTHLQGAVTTAGDAGLTVASVPVAVETGVATVNLQGARLADDEARARGLWAQLARAVLAVPGVSGLDIQLGGFPLAVEGIDPPVGTDTDLGYADPNLDVDVALLRVGEELTRVDPSRYDLSNSPDPEEDELPRVGMGWTGVAASADLADFAAVSTSRDRLWRWRAGETHTNEGIGDQLTDPSYDRTGGIWVAGVSRGGDEPRVWVIDDGDLATVARPVDLTWLQPDERVESFRVSPDGARAVLVLGAEESATRRVVVAGIVRDSSGRAVAMAEPVAVAPTLDDVASARWATPTRLLVVGMRADDTLMTPYEVPIGGWLDERGAQPGLVVALPVPTGTGYHAILRTDDGHFHTAEGSEGWYDARNGDELVVPGT